MAKKTEKQPTSVSTAEEKKAKQLANQIEKIRADILKGKTSVRYCTPEQAADYLLAFSEPPPDNDRKGICFYSFPISIDFSRTPAAKEQSERGDGIFKPLTATQRQSVENVLKQLENIGIPIETCQQNFVKAFSEDDGYYKIVFYSFEKNDIAFQNNVDISSGRAFRLFGNKDGAHPVAFIGLNIHDKDAERTIFHEIGHTLDLPHFPPNYGNFDALCAPDFYNKVE